MIIDDFLKKYNFNLEKISIEKVADSLLEQMNFGLQNSTSISPEMIPTWLSPDVDLPKNRNVIVLDAGGTNFRSFLVKFDSVGHPKILKFEKQKMPALEREYEKEEFFDKIADYLEYLRDEAEQINFSFSYAVEITPESDGRVIRFSKEIKADKVLGSLLGESLMAALNKKGWKTVKSIYVLNDTTSALLSGKLLTGKEYSSYVGFILGTGLNAAYVESDAIPKLGSREILPQIIVSEIGKAEVEPSAFDELLYTEVSDGSICKLEKMCSGAYLGKLLSIVLRFAAKEKLFSEKLCEVLAHAGYNFAELNDFLCNTNLEQNAFYAQIKTIVTAEDENLLRELFSTVLLRTEKLVTAMIVAVCEKSKAGKNPDKPICIIAEGTTFAKGYNLHTNILKLLNTELTQKRNIYFELNQPENAVTFGSAICSKK